MNGWVGTGRVRARQDGRALEIAVEGLTTQAKYYKPLIYEFFRKEYVGEPPWLDLDNLAKALLDAIKGYAFHDDAQVARLLVERHAGERERVTIRVTPYADQAGSAS